MSDEQQPIETVEPKTAAGTQVVAHLGKRVIEIQFLDIDGALINRIFVDQAGAQQHATAVIQAIELLVETAKAHAKPKLILPESVAASESRH